MTGTEIALIVTASGTLIASFGVAFVGIYTAIIAGRIKDQGVIIEATHASTNSKMDKLLEVSALAAKAEGKLEGKAEAEAATKPAS